MDALSKSMVAPVTVDDTDPSILECGRLCDELAVMCTALEGVPPRAMEFDERIKAVTQSCVLSISSFCDSRNKQPVVRVSV